ncbi:MAG: flagellar GTP-binding protein [Opitutaceae bacterium]|nr:flagellar GTP-binding protein [Opitutaceae bacterium]
MSPSAFAIAENRPPANAIYKLVVRSAEEAVRAIRTQLGEKAKVLSVRQLPGQGLSGLFGRPRLEVIAQLDSGEGEETRDAATRPVENAPIPGTLEAGTPAERESRGQSVRVRLKAETAARAAESAPRLPDLLRRSGFSEALVSRFQTLPTFSADAPLHRALADFGQALRSGSASRPARALPSRVAFMGTAGSGRTTALSKWLSQSVFVHGRRGRVIKAEFDRPNLTEGLSVFCEAVGLTLEHYIPGETGVRMIADVSAEEFILVDLPALSLQATANAGMVRFLNDEKIDGRVLVLNALHDLASLRAAYNAGRSAGATHLVFTHLDELGHWGKLLDFLVDGEVTPLFLATGPSLTGDLEADAVGAVLRKTLPGS